MKPQAVYDTNVIISAILNPAAFPPTLFSLAMRGAVQIFLSPALLAEYTEVVKRPVFRIYRQKLSIGFSRSWKTQLSWYIRQCGKQPHWMSRITASLNVRLRQKPSTL